MLSAIGGVFSFFANAIKLILFGRFKEAGRMEERVKQQEETRKRREKQLEVSDPTDNDLRDRLHDGDF